MQVKIFQKLWKTLRILFILIHIRIKVHLHMNNGEIFSETSKSKIRIIRNFRDEHNIEKRVNPQQHELVRTL